MDLKKVYPTLDCTLVPVCTSAQEFDEATLELSHSDISVNGIGDYQLRSLSADASFLFGAAFGGQIGINHVVDTRMSPALGF